jgi:hypothetical protein
VSVRRVVESSESVVIQEWWPDSEEVTDVDDAEPPTFAHLKRILRLDRLRLRGPNGARDEFLLAATAQNLRKMAKLIPTPNFKPA